MPDLTRCNLCGSHVDARLRFCGNCGAELRLAAPGLVLPRALAWKGHLTKLGWWETPDERFRPLLGALIEAGKLPTYDSSLEPWVLYSNGAFENWKLCAMRQADDGGRFTWQPDTAVLATRCRLLTLGLDGHVTTIWYTDLRLADRDRYQALSVIHLADRHGVELRLGMPFEGTRFIQVTGSLDPPPVPQTSVPATSLQEAITYQVDFHEVVAMFLTAIARLAREFQ